MNFIFADCLDYVDPDFDFLNDCNAPGRKPYWNDQFPHEFMDAPPYDGVLISRAIVGDHRYPGKYTESQAMRFRREGARAFLRYGEKRFPGSLLFGDCGAFQYHKLEVPPYTPTDMLDFYADGGFTHGCSVDHIIFECDSKYDRGESVPEELIRRRDITVANADIFLKESKGLGRNFQPLGVVQAWSPQSMAETSLNLVKMGYDYLALGGLVPLRIELIKEVLQAVRELVPPHVRMHILGFAKANELDGFKRYSITSFDTTSPLITAFKDSRRNYWALKSPQEIEYYLAIRIPQAHENNKIKNLVKSGKLVQEVVVMREQRALERVRAFAVGNCGLEETLAAVMDYTSLILQDDGKDGVLNQGKLTRLEEGYRKTLSARPWEQCSCRVCRECGVEAVIFRGSNRNKRRGIHNLQAFYSYLGNINERE